MNNHSRGIVAGVTLSLLLTGLLFAAPLSMSQSFTALQNIGLITMIGDAEAQLAKPAATFDTTDAPGPWFNNTATGNSLAIVKPGDTVRFIVGSSTNTVHTVTSLLWPTGASDMPADQPVAFEAGIVDITLSDAGLYVFVCKVHPFMLAAVIADDDSTTELDLGETVDLFNGINNLPTASDLALRLLRGFFVITTPSNWQVFNPTGTSTWDPSYPAAPILAHDPDGNPVSIPNLDSFLQGYFNETALSTLPPVFNPSTEGVGEVWVDTQYELTESKTKPGTVTAVDASSWQVIRKVALPEINMNNPHNMWTDKDQKYIYQTQWFDKYLTTFDRSTGELVANTEVGEAPAHVMTRVDTDFVHVSLNGEDSVVELKPKGETIIREIPIESTNDNQAQPHAHWMGHDGQTMVTPNSNTLDSTLYKFGAETQTDVHTGTLPIATGMMPDSSKYYVSNFLDNTISVVTLNPHEVIKQINLLADYDPIPLDGTNFADNDGNGVIAVGALPIQTPVSPNGKYVVTANTLTNTITIIDTDTDTLEKMLACDAGCHGVNFGAKNGGGYYAYVSSKFANTLIVVDIDPNNDGEADDAEIAGRIVLDAISETEKDDTISGYTGMGGQGVLPIPLVYNGWVQNLPEKWQDKLTDEQLDPLGEGVDDTLTPDKDSFIRSSATDTNAGANEVLILQKTGDKKSLVSFDLSSFETQQVSDAKLKLFVTHNGGNWGDGRTIAAHKLLSDWTEGNGIDSVPIAINPNVQKQRGTGEGVTWACATDTNIANTQPDCSSEWNGGSFESKASDLVLITSTTEGVWIEFDVTADVKAFLKGDPTDNFGWLIKKSKQNDIGQIAFASKESSELDQRPQLVLKFDQEDKD